MIRQAAHEDMPEILRLSAEFLSIGPYAWAPLDLAAFEAFAHRMIDDGAIFLSDDGIIGGCLYPLYFNPSVVLVAELFWFARKEGRQLREALEAWGRAKGCVGATCSGLANDREATIRRLYGRAGYDATEVAFVKRFEP